MFEITDKIYLGSAKPNNSAEWGNIEGTLSNQTDLNTALSGKQATLVSGTNIKTVNGVSLLGSGDVVIGEGGTIAIDQTYNSESANAQSGTAVAEAILTKANTSLDNLSSDGQMIVDSQNGTISNCVLEIPQNIKLTLENNVLTLKAGSVIALTNSDSYSTYTTTSDLVRENLTLTANKRYIFLSAFNGSSFTWQEVSKVGSGDTLPADNTNYNWFFLTTDKAIYSWKNNTWERLYVSYPIAVIESDNSGNPSFAKDSNGNDMIFNGAGFIGHHAFVYPNVTGLAPYGYNEDGTLKSVSGKTSTLQIIKLNSSSNSIDVLLTGGTLAKRSFKEVQDIDTSWTGVQYVKSENMTYVYSSGSYVIRIETPLIYYTYEGTTVTDFAIQQPVRMATTEMLDKKQADITTITGYDATKTQTLKNVSGVLTWVDDGE